jgi:putative nucleotidyltransferase with HDIG domain
VISAQDIAQRIDSLPPLSTSVVQLRSLLAKQNQGSRLSVGELERVARCDPALTANLLRVANSAYYRGKYPVTSVRAAIVRLGTKGMFEVALGLSLRRVVPPMLPGYELSAPAFIRHAVAVGVLCERLAREACKVDRDTAFTFGLLHDIGKLVVSTYLSEQSSAFLEMLQKPSFSLEEAERALLDIDHGEVGSETARKWQLPPAVEVATRWHHEPAGAPDGDLRQIAAMVHVADGLAHLMGYGPDVGGLHRRMEAGVPDQLGLRIATIDRVISETLEPIEELSEALTLATTE